jgi:hypothetical protein
MKSAVVVSLLCGAVAGCSAPNPRTAVTTKPMVGWQTDLEVSNKVPRVVVQVCWPSAGAVVSFETLTGPPIVSSNHTPAKQTGSTRSGQPVFETYSAFASDLRANVVSARRPATTMFVFDTAQVRLGPDWSAWQVPRFASNDDSLTWKMLHGRPYERLASPDDAPRLRYILMPFNDYLGRVRQRRTGEFAEDVPPC